MIEELVKRDTAILAKEKGFNEQCRHYLTIDGDIEEAQYFESDITNKSIDNNEGYFSDIPSCTIPTQALLQKWLREEHNIYLHVKPNYPIIDNKVELNFSHNHYQETPINYSTWEEALEQGLILSLNSIKNGKESDSTKEDTSK